MNSTPLVSVTGLGYDLGRCLVLAVAVALDHGDHAVDLDAGLATCRLDPTEQVTDGVDHAQQHVCRVLVHEAASVTQLDEEALPDVRDPLEVAEGEEPAGPLDGVDRAEDAREQLTRPRGALQRDQVLVQLVQVLVALDQELPNDVVNVVH